MRRDRALQKREQAREEKPSGSRAERKGRQDRKIQTLLSREERARRSLLETMTDGAGVEWRKDETGWWWWRDDEGEWQWRKIPYTPKRRPQRFAKSEPAPSEPESSPSEPAPSEQDSLTSSVSTALSIDEDREAQKYAQKLLEIEALQARKDQGEVLNKYEESTIRRRGEFYYAPVMVNLRNSQMVDLASMD
jgi:hypothetical protein